MKNWAFAFMILGLVACGADQTPNYVTPSLDDLGKDLKNGYDYVEVRVADGADVVVDQGGEAQDHLGAKANESRQHLSDRNASAEDANKNYVSKKDRAGEKANEIRKDLSDGGVSSEQFADKYTEAQDHVGKKANDAREYTYTRGPEEVRWGDQSTQDQAASSAGRLDSAEARLAAIEAVNEAQDSLLSILKGALEAETAARKLGDSELEQEFKAGMDDFNSTFVTLTDSLQSQLNGLSARISSNDTDITVLQAGADSIRANLLTVRQDVVDQLKTDSAFLDSIASNPLAKGNVGNDGYSVVSTTGYASCNGKGGKRIKFWSDRDRSGGKSQGDILLSQSVVCNGQDGADGDPGTNGSTCSVSLVPLVVLVTNSGFDGDCGGWNKKCRESDFDETVNVTIDIPQVICI